MQKSCKSRAIKLACFAEMQLILCKITSSFIFHPMILYHRVGMGCQWFMTGVFLQSCSKFLSDGLGYI